MFAIWGQYQGGEAEEIDTAADRKEARYLIGEYRLAFGAGWVLWMQREREGVPA